jgi:hypothetical protein
MQTATMSASDAMADRILAFGANLEGRQRQILRHMVGAGRARLARSGPSEITARDAQFLLDEKAREGLNNDTRWTFDVWKHSF